MLGAGAGTGLGVEDVPVSVAGKLPPLPVLGDPELAPGDVLAGLPPDGRPAGLPGVPGLPAAPGVRAAPPPGGGP